MARSSKLNWQFVRSTAGIFRLCVSPMSATDVLLCLAIPVSVVAYVISGYLMLLVPGDIYSALIQEDVGKFKSAMARLFGACVATVLSRSLIGLSRDWAANVWRLRLTKKLHAEYLVRRENPPAFYVLSGSAVVDNPDQRITEDARRFCFTLATIIAGGYGSGGMSGVGSVGGGLFEALITVSWYTAQAQRRTGWTGVAVGYFWSALVALGGYFMVNQTSTWVMRQEALEGDLRSGHVEILKKAEDIAFYGQCRAEEAAMNIRLEKAVGNMRRVILWRSAISALDNGFSYLVSFVMYVTIGTVVFTGFAEERGFYHGASEQARWISQTGGIFISLLYSLTIFIQLNSPAASLASQVTRLHILREECDAVSEKVVPQASCLLYTTRALTLRVDPGQRLLIRGPNGCGKTTVLRQLRGLWSVKGKVSRPALVGCDWAVEPGDALGMDTAMFLTRSAVFICDLPLLEQVNYPKFGPLGADAEVRVETILERVGLKKLITRYGLRTPQNWAALLSPGESQRLAIGRVLWHRPQFIVLDEATSSLDAESERSMLCQLQATGAGMIVVSHNLGIDDLFDRVQEISASLFQRPRVKIVV
mmetsp:Transcript_9157/g.27557  ORF Transcript_9157/g.27557 Transcript_9157/m.27557 type:complete len:592 (-) Transcript_9157:1924-3699(-)